MVATKNSLSANARKKITAALAPVLADAQDLYSQVKQAHWNVRGPSFIALHELFDQIATDVNAAVDEIAERIVQLGEMTQGTVRASAKASRLKEYPLTVRDEAKHVEALSTALATFSKHCRDTIQEIEDHGDVVTEDLLTGVARTNDKNLWFVEAHKAA